MSGRRPRCGWNRRAVGLFISATMTPGSEPMLTAEQVEVDERRVADEDQQRRGLTQHAGESEHDAGDDVRPAPWEERCATMVFHLGTPSAYDASRRSCGTMRSISSVLRTTTGTISSTSARDTAKRRLGESERGDPQRVDEQRRDDRRHTAEDVDHEGGDLAELGLGPRTPRGRSRRTGRAGSR